MLNLDTEFISDICDKIRQFQAKEEVSFPQATDEMDALHVLADYEDDAVYQEALAVINNLRADQQATLVALMYLSRDDYSHDDWNEAYNLAFEQQTNRTGEYLLATPLAADYIEESLNKLGISP